MSQAEETYIQSLFAERIGGSLFGKDTKIYKFEKIKRAKRAAMDANPGVELIDLGVGEPDEMARQLGHVLRGYRLFREFDAAELHVLEALRTLRLLHYSAWLARRWNDPAFPAAFPWFDTPRYWQDRILELREQIARMQEPCLTIL